MSYQVEMSRAQLERIHRALVELDKVDPPKPDPKVPYGQDCQYLTGCAEDTLEHPEDNKMLHGWCL